jgi:sugar lactone lactonase YvrE
VPLNFIPYDEKTKPLDKAEADRRIFRLTPGVPDSLAVDTEGVKSFLTQILKGM